MNDYMPYVRTTFSNYNHSKSSSLSFNIRNRTISLEGNFYTAPLLFVKLGTFQVAFMEFGKRFCH